MMAPVQVLVPEYEGFEYKGQVDKVHGGQRYVRMADLEHWHNSGYDATQPKLITCPYSYETGSYLLYESLPLITPSTIETKYWFRMLDITLVNEGQAVNVRNGNTTSYNCYYYRRGLLVWPQVVENDIVMNPLEHIDVEFSIISPTPEQLARIKK